MHVDTVPQVSHYHKRINNAVCVCVGRSVADSQLSEMNRSCRCKWFNFYPHHCPICCHSFESLLVARSKTLDIFMFVIHSSPGRWDKSVLNVFLVLSGESS